MTNGDKIKKEIQEMDNNELSFILGCTACDYCIYVGRGCSDKNCKEGIQRWLESECES